MTLEVPVFDNPTEEIAYWRTKAEEYKLAAETSREELDEFQVAGRELEAELETQLEQTEIKNKELKSLTNRLQMENDQIKDKLEQCNREYHYQINELQSELQEIKGIKDKLAKYVRELEQQNDDLERAKRSTLASLEDFEMRMNVAIERNAFLESELDEKEQLKTVVQRLKDETRDLRSELRVLNPQFEEDEEPDNDRVIERSLSQVNSTTSTQDKINQDSEQLCNEKMNGDTPLKQQNGVLGGLPNSPPLTPSARISALGIVGDLLRKVGALELKLVSCRNIVKENGKDGGREFSNINSIDRKSRMPRGASSPAVKNLCENGTS